MTYVGRVVDLVETLEQSKDAALNLLLVQAGGGRVHANGNGLGSGAEGSLGRDEGSPGEGSGLLDGGTDGARGGGRGTEDCCAEHCGGIGVDCERRDFRELWRCELESGMEEMGGSVGI